MTRNEEEDLVAPPGYSPVRNWATLKLSKVARSYLFQQIYKFALVDCLENECRTHVVEAPCGLLNVLASHPLGGLHQCFRCRWHKPHLPLENGGVSILVCKGGGRK